MHSLPFRPTVAQYRAYLTTHGVAVPSRLRKDDVADIALLVRFSTLTDVRRVPGVKLDEVALLAAWAESRPGMHPVDRGETVPDAVPCAVVYPHMPHDDGTPIACTLPTGHDGDHMDRSHVDVPMPVEPAFTPGTPVRVLSGPTGIVRDPSGIVLRSQDRDGVDGRVVKLTTGPQVWVARSNLLTDRTSPLYTGTVWAPCEYCGRDVDAATVAPDRLPVCDRSVCQQLAQPQSTPVPCEYFAMCDRHAAGTTSHPVLGAVPTCQRCADRFDLDVRPF